MGVLEGMAAGLKPVVHDFPGAKDTFGTEWLFRTPREFCDLVESREYHPQQYRAFVEQRYSLQAQLEQVGRVLAELESGVGKGLAQGAGSCGR